MSMPKFATEALNKQGIPTADKSVPCKGASQFGELTLVIGGKDYTLDSEEWMFPAQQGNMAQTEQKLKKMQKFGPLGPQILTEVGSTELPQSPASVFELMLEEEFTKHPSHSQGELSCGSTIMTMDIAKQMFLVGDVFMRKYYTIFDRTNDRVGLATAVTNDKIKSLSSR